MMDELRAVVGFDEKILYEGKPNLKCYIFESIFNPMLPFAIIWAIIDLSILGTAFLSSGSEETLYFLIPFILLHMMPVWIYLSGVLFMVRKYKNTFYVVTDKAIYVSSGLFTKNINSKTFAELSHINLHRGIFDQIFNVGDVIATTNHYNRKGKLSTINIASISDYTVVYNLVKKIQTDIYSDVMYPNANRFVENPGYNTIYKGL